MKADCFLGIDLGTSAIKLLLVSSQGVIGRAKCAYSRPDADGWLEALQSAVAQLKKENDLTRLSAMALCSQVGTYLTDTHRLLSWQDSAGKEQLQQIKSTVSKAQFLNEIGMDHPDLISYPLPRLMYLQQKEPGCHRVCMPKEHLLQALTGNCISDIFSWRGLCHPATGSYAQPLLTQFGIDLALPPLALPTDLAGHITAAAAHRFGLPQGVPVYVGCNDFYAGLLGMGIWDVGSLFELSGTSEHLGVITEKSAEDAFVSGAYFNGFATYGGTKSSGACCSYAIDRFGLDAVSCRQAFEKPPVFLPYLNGERAPIFDDDARGVFFGISAATESRDMAYAVLEGVVFSLYHIGQSLPLAGNEPLITGGGSSGNLTMAQLKAALFDRPVLQVEESDSSAMGAALIAMTGQGLFPHPGAAAKATVTYRTLAKPDPQLRQRLLERFDVYQQLYPSLKSTFQAFSKQ